MSRQIIINSGIREKRAGILVNNRLEDVFFEQDTYEQIAGNIYSGIVRDVLPGMQAAFVDIGSDRNSFLHISDLFPILNTDQLERWKNNKLGIQHVLQPGQELLIQVIKEAIGSKGPKVTCKITIPGRYFVLLPYEDRVNISRKINDPEERQRLSKLTGKLLGDEYGVIIRTNAADKGYDELKMDLDYLTHTWDEVQNENSKKNAPSLIYQHVGLIQQIIRDHLSDDIDKLVIDNHDEYQKIVRMLNRIAPHLSKKIVCYQRKNPIFSTYGIEKELSRVLNRRVWLDSGGYIIIDKTEALVAIDVNTGKYTGKKNLQDTVFKTNLEAAKEIARQLRLRDIGGIIIIDFIDMTIREHQEKVLAALSKELARDKTKTAILGLTQLGLVEMTRKKVREGYGELIQKECPYCQGTGMVVSEGTMSLRVIREINELAVNEDFSALYLEMHPRVAAVLIGTGGEKLAELEEKFALDIYVSGNDELHIEDYTIKKGKKEEMADLALPVKEGEEYRLLIEEKQLNNSEDGIARIKGYIIIIKGGGHLVGNKLKIKITDVARTFARAEIIK